MWRGRRKLKSSRSGSTLTTGLALAELAREEARELELRWPPYSEGCHEATPGCADRNKGTGSAKRQREQKATKITLQSAYGLATHTAERKERLGLGSKPGLEKEPTSAACSGKLLPRIRKNCILHRVRMQGNAKHHPTWVCPTSYMFTRTAC